MRPDSAAPQADRLMGLQEGQSGPGDAFKSAAPQVAAPPKTESAGHSGGGYETAPRRVAMPEGLRAQRGAPGHSGAQRQWTEAQRLCLRYLDWLGPLDLRNLAAAAQLPQGEALAALRGLRALGHVARVADAWRATDRAIAARRADGAKP